MEGHLAPRRYVTLALAAPGRAAEVYYEEGQPVEAGAVLVRMASYPERVADLDSAELDLVCAQQALDDLNENADVALAQAEVTLAQATYERDFAYDRLESFQKRPSQLRVDQAYANMILADNQLELAQEALDRAEKKFNNKKSLVWYFTNRHDFRLQITLLEQNLAEKQRRYNAAKEKYQDIIAPVDPVDLALRRSEYAVAKARWRMARRDRDELRGGPDPEALETARARLSAAQANLAAARKALVAAEIVAPLSGVLVKLDAKPGQWIPAGKPVAQIADLSEWKVVAEEVPEASVPRVQPGEQVRLEIPAAPGFETNGHVEAVDLFYTEEDGDIYYTVEIGLEETDSGGIQRRLRWGMSVQVAFADE